MKNYVSVDVGGTMIKYAVIDEEGKILINKEVETNADLGGKHILEKVISIVEDCTKSFEYISGVGISTAGIVDTEKGEIVYANELLPGYTGINYKRNIEEKFNIPCEVENDVNCAGLSEAYVGSSKDSKISVCLTIGTNIGGCLIIDKKVINGFSNSACEVGYLNMFGDIFQNLASTTRLVKNVSKRKDVDFKTLNGKIIFEKAKQGDKDCLEEIDNMCDMLGYGISNICYVVNPQTVVLGGGIMLQKEFLKDRLKNSLEKYLIKEISKFTTIEFAQNGNLAGVLGAYYNFKSKH